MHQIDQDLIYLRSAVAELEDYLLSNVLFWPVTARGGKQLRGDTTQLTIGNLLLSLKRLASAAEENENSTEIAALSRQVEMVRRRWKSNWDKKIGEEIRSRLRQWDQYLSEISQPGGIHHGDYPYNIRQRVILGLLFNELDKPSPHEAVYLDALDTRLRHATHPVDFVWDVSLSAGLPESEYWYLYRQPA